MDNFKGTAEYYKHRPQYPDEIISEIAKELSLDGSGSLLDVGCGPGSLSIPLSHYVEHVVAVDSSSEMIREGMKRASEEGVANISWRTIAGEELTPDVGTFRVVTFGNSLHWFDQAKMLDFVHHVLEPHGYVVIIGVSSIWRNSPELWQQKILSIIKKYLGEERKTLDGTFPKKQSSYSDALRAAGFANIEVKDLSFPKRALTADEIIQEQHSTSYAAPELFGDRRAAFDEELKRELLTISPINVFEESRRGSLVIAQKN
jgi:ubiquinone/menaquinone biosynthesis C-methylase UbiE